MYCCKIVLSLFLLLKLTACYRPVVLIHGIEYDNSDYMIPLANYIQTKHPDTEVHLLEILEDTASYLPFWYQMTEYVGRITQIIRKSNDGIHVIGYSQGGITSRGIIETLSSHNVHTYISLAGPQLGINGEYFKPKKSLFHVGSDETDMISTAGIYRKASDLDELKRKKAFLAAVNNEFKHDLNDQFKRNICDLKRMVLVGGPDDGLVIPWQTSIFGYDDGKGNIIPMKEQEVYKNDNFCLRTLDERGAVIIHTFEGVDHNHWVKNVTVFDKAVIPYLD